MNLLSLLLVTIVAIVYSWTIYNVPVLIVGVKSCLRDRREKKAHERDKVPRKKLPSYSIIIPVKNEEVVIHRLLKALLRQNYPREKVEIIIVEDGSTDGTLRICKEFACGSQVKLLHGRNSLGKPSALNRASGMCSGDIIAVFDADSIPEQDVLLNAAKYFYDGSTVALQGRTLTVNSEVNMLTKFVSHEESLWYEGYLRGRDALDLFVHLRGSCQFVRRDVLKSVGGWSEKHLSEDFEMSARLTERGFRIRYAPDVKSWQESPQSLSQMFRQRIRWFRGTMEVALSYGRLMRKLSFKTFDAEVTLLAPFVLILSLLSYIVAPLAIHYMDGSTVLAITMVGWALLTASIMAGAMSLLYVAKPKRIRDLLWIPFIYAYWTFQVFLATWALICIIFKVSNAWRKTPKTGTVTVSHSFVQAVDNQGD